MEKSSKEQLINLVFNRCNEIAIKNFEKFREHMSDLGKESQDNGAKMIVEFVIEYGNEIRMECCQTFAEILYDIFYA